MENNKVLSIKKIRKFLNSFQSKKFPFHSSIFYPACYINSIGSYTLSRHTSKKQDIKKSLKLILKDFLYSINYVNYKIKAKKILPNYEKIFLTWSLDGDFDTDGSLNDRYLNINSKKFKDTLWFVIHVGKNAPKKIKNNIVLIYFRKNYLNIFALLKFFIRNLIFIFSNFSFFLNSISNYNFLAEIVLKEMKKFIKKDLRLVFMPFEGQPFQNKLIFYLREKFSKVKVLGYVHSPPLPLPTNFIFRKNSCPQNLILNGNDQFYCFSKYLGWDKASLKISESFRFLKENRKKGINSIFLPVEIKDPKNIFNNLKYLMHKLKIDINDFSIKNHPASSSSKNEKLIRLILNLKQKRAVLEKNQKKISIFIGNTGSIIESLERGVNVIHICEIDHFDSYSTKLYPSIFVKKISKNIYQYKLRKKNRLIKFGYKNNNFKNLFKIIKSIKTNKML